MHSAVSSGGMHAPDQQDMLMHFEELSLGAQISLNCRGLMELLQIFSEAMVSLSGQLERDCGQGSCAEEW
jgi:hypothetical protein